MKDAIKINSAIKSDRRLPYDTGNLRNHIITQVKGSFKTQEIVINIASNKVPYVKYLEEGTAPHNIPHAFGYGSIYEDKPNPYTKQTPYGVGGRFNGKFHPGSTKHKGFIETILIYNCLNYYVHNYDVIKIERD